ncbi:hypothetical protein [Paenibacillus elgii]|uniref:hypothetical protein n=1 Tax=Paenibacillus elgii TaxID=189691 RepID=UPI0003072789|nr:hypothetical protein [Paenibacillus elgii]
MPPQIRQEKKKFTLASGEGHDLKVGNQVTMTIDWNRRYRLMRLHFAAEIILELAYKHLEGIEKIDAHVAQDKARINYLGH